MFLVTFYDYVAERHSSSQHVISCWIRAIQSSQSSWHSETVDDTVELQINTFLTGLIQLCHYNTQLAHDVWLMLFPRCWKVLSERMQAVS